MGGSGGRRRLGGPLEAERAPYLAPSRLSLTQASSYSFPVVRRCPAVTAPPGVPGTPQPGHCASSGPGPHPVLTCCSWEHEEPHRPTHCGEAPLHHRQALTLLIPSLPRAPSWATPSPRWRAFFSQILSNTAQSFPLGGGLHLPCAPQLFVGSLVPVPRGSTVFSAPHSPPVLELWVGSTVSFSFCSSSFLSTFPPVRLTVSLPVESGRGCHMLGSDRTQTC